MYPIGMSLPEAPSYGLPLPYMPVDLSKKRNNKKQLAEMKRKQIAKRRKRRFLFNRS